MLKMMFARCFPLALLLLLCTCVSAQTAPEPAVGTRWTVNNDFTDEFNADQLDEEKWFDYHPRWLGRQPAIFLPRQVSLVDGLLQIQNTRLEQDTTVTFFDGTMGTYSIGGGAVVSRKIEAYHGYYEVRMKASDISMSSTFWMSNPATQGDCPNYSLELDIVETIGGAKNFPAFATQMKSNSHYFQTACDGTRRDFDQAAEGAIGGNSSEAFHRYGCWWKDENNMTFYIDGVASHSIRANTGGEARPFNRPMHINMVTETYDWEQAPTDAELADDQRNTTYYDYIHAYELRDVDTPAPARGSGNLLVNPGFETGDFTGWTGWGGAPREVIMAADAQGGDFVAHIVGGGAPEQIITLDANTDYILGTTARVPSGRVTLGVKPADSNENIASTVFDSTGWVRKEISFNTGNVTEVKIFFFAQTAGDEGFADEFTLERADGGVVEPALLQLEESFLFKNFPQLVDVSTGIEFSFLFQANEPRDIVLRLLDANDMQQGDEMVYRALPGYGHKSMLMPLPAGIADGDVFRLEGDIRPVGSTDGEIIDFGRLVLNVGGTTTGNRNITAEQLQVFPNPVKDELTVAGLRRASDFRIMDAAGRIVRNGRVLADGRIDANGLKPGLYLMLIGEGAFARFVKR